MMKKISIIATTLALAVALGSAMAKPPKRHTSNPPKSPRVFKKVPNSPYEDRLRQYEEDRRKGWYKVDKA